MNIENTATPCYQSNPLSGTNQYNNDTYSDRMTQESHHHHQQCTCHETASKLLLYNDAISNNVESDLLLDWQPQYQQQLDNFTGMDANEYYKPAISPSTSSLRFLNGQTKSPRRRSSVSRINSGLTSRRRSTVSHLSRPVISVEDFDLTDQTEGRNRMASYSMMDYQQMDPEQRTTSLVAPVYSKSSSASIISSPSSNSPNSTHTDEINLGNYTTNDLGLMSTGPDELTNLLNNVLMDSSSQSPMSTQFLEDTYYQQQPQTTAATDMTRSTTISSSCSSSYAASTMMIPPQPSWCGSLVPHVSCAPSSAINQGESVVITITPLQNTKPAVTRIVTCYSGDSCNCPGCFVHPNNLLAMNQQQEPQLKQYSRSSFSSSSSSSYSSDDEVLYQQPR